MRAFLRILVGSQTLAKSGPEKDPDVDIYYHLRGYT